MKFKEIASLLEAAPMSIETGYERFSSGVLHVACHTDLQGCTGPRFE